MSSATPPNPYFSGINFNPSFFTVISGYLTETIANTKYLRLIGGTLSGFLGIKRTARVELDVNGKAIINDATNGVPANGILGSTGTKLILTEGTASETPIAIGSSSDGMWMGTNSTTGISFYTGLSHRMRIKNNGYVGIGTTDAKSLLTVNNFPAITNAFDFSVTPTTITNTTPTSSSVLNDPLPTLFLCREGTVTQAYASRSTFSLCRWENNGNNSRTRLDIGVSHGQFDNINIMSLRSDGNVGIGTTNPQYALDLYNNVDNSQKPFIRLRGGGGPNNQVGIILDAFYNRTGTASTKIYAEDNGNAASHLCFATAETGSTTNAIERMRIKTDGNVGIGTTNPQSLLHMHSSANSADIALRITDNTTGTAATRGIAIQKTNMHDMFLFVYESARMYFFTNNSVRMNILANGYVGIGAISPDTVSNCLQVGDGGKLRIANDGEDYTLIGTKNGVDGNNTRIVINGYQKAGNLGNISYVATTGTGAHTFWLNNSTSVADIDYTDFTVFNSITTIGANYYTDGEYISYSTKTNVGGTVKSGYFISNEYFFNSFINIAVSHNSIYYTYWHGHYGTNNTPAVMYVSSISNYAMTFESFDEQTTFKSWIYCCPTITFNSATQLRVKFYG